MLQAIDIPRFNFIERGKLDQKEHVYFVTTDIEEAADHYLQKIIKNDSNYMTISSISGELCVAKSCGLDDSHSEPKIIKMSDCDGLNLRRYTEDFLNVVKNDLHCV